ncbi:hypothetical protein D3C80_823940 [compost metagenome]
MAKNSVLDYNATADNNTDIGGIGIQGTSAVNNFDNAFRTIMAQISDLTGGNTLASGTTTDLSTVPGQFVVITGNATINSFGLARTGWTKHLRFVGAPTLVHSAALVLSSAANISVADGDTATFVSDDGVNWRCTEYFSIFAKRVLDEGDGLNMFNAMGAEFTYTTTTIVVKLPNGFILQAGLFAGAGINPEVTFPEAFPNLVIAPGATMLVSAASDTAYSISIGVRSTTSMQLFRRSMSNGGTVAGSTEPFFWWALGR